MSWIESQSTTITIVINCLTLLVWFTYLHLLFMGFLRQRKSKILITRGNGADLKGRCFVSNMSAEPVYVQTVIAIVDSASCHQTLAITDFGDLASDTDSSAKGRQRTFQGPLETGKSMVIGRFDEIVERVISESSHSSEQLEDVTENIRSVELVVLAAYGSDDLGIGAKRRFQIVGRGRERDLLPETVKTIQIHSRRERRRLTQDIKKYL